MNRLWHVINLRTREFVGNVEAANVDDAQVLAQRQYGSHETYVGVVYPRPTPVDEPTTTKRSTGARSNKRK